MRYKKALVTGASSGIGLSICKYLSREGVETIALARNKSRLKTALRGVSKNTKVIVDVSDTDKFLQELSRLDSDIDLLICNVGAGGNMSLKNQQSKEIEKVISTNLTSTILLTQHLLANKRKESELQIVLVSSLAGKMSFPGLSVYSATKFGIEGFAEALRYELEEKEKVKICVLRPGVTDTNFFIRAVISTVCFSKKETNLSPGL